MTSPSINRHVERSGFFVGLLFAGFVATGAVTVLLAPMLPLLSARWTLTDKSAGFLFTCQFAGSMAGTLLSGTLIRKLGLSKTLFVGYLLMAVYALTVWKLPWPYLIALLSINGVGIGLVVPATNMAVSDLFPHKRASALNAINLSWSVGAIFLPALLAWAARTNMLWMALEGLSAVSFAVALLLFKRTTIEPEHSRNARSNPIPKVPLFILACLFFLYIGAEGAIGGWLATYTKRTTLSTGVLWMTAPSYFWAAIMLGRAIVPFLLRRVSERSIVLAGLAMGTAGLLGIQISSTSTYLFTAVIITGLGLAGVFPIFIAMVSHQFGEAAGRISPYLFAMAGLGGAVLPWVVGVVSSQSGSLHSGLLVALAGVALQLCLVIILNVSTAGAEVRANT